MNFDKRSVESDIRHIDEIVAEFEGKVYSVILTWNDKYEYSFYYLDGIKPADSKYFEFILLSELKRKNNG